MLVLKSSPYILVAVLSSGLAAAQAPVAVQDPAALRPLFETLQRAVKAHDAAAIAPMVRYPIVVHPQGNGRMIAHHVIRIGSPEQFIAMYDQIVTPDIAAAVVGSRWGHLRLTDRGVELGEGQVLLDDVCEDDACTHRTAKVVAFDHVMGVSR